MVARARWLIYACALLLAGADWLRAQSKRPEDLATGKVLVIRRDAPDPHFSESVILLVQHDEKGAVGLMLNRRTTMPISSALRELPTAVGHSDPVFVGGPVQLETVFALARAQRKPEGAAEVAGDIYLLAARPALEKALRGPSSPSALRVYLGYCGWGPRQLENEVSHGGWYIFDRREDVTFDTDPTTLWSRLIAKAEVQVARLGFILSIPAGEAGGVRVDPALRPQARTDGRKG